MSITHINNLTEFKEERKVLLEVIGPELQSIYDDRQIEVRLENVSGEFSLSINISD